MVMMIIINLIGLGLIGFIVWWFLIAKPAVTIVLKDKENGENIIDIIVQNGMYEPALIKAKAGENLQLRFLRKDTSPCSQIVIFDKLDISAKLLINEHKIISLPLLKPGEFEFTCQMGMYRGKLVVE